MKYIILGAGLSGLSLAYFLKDNYEIFEKEDHPGGLCSSIIKQGFVFDKGPHLFNDKSQEFIDFLNTQLEDNLLTGYSNPAQFSYGVLIKYPYTVNLKGLPVDVIKDCILGIIEAKYNKNQEHVPENYEDWCYYNFGKGITEHFRIPYAKKYWTINPKLLTTEWVSRVIHLPELDKVIEGALKENKENLYYFNDFLYPAKNGVQGLIDSLASKANNLNLNHEVTEINLDTKTITFNKTKQIPFNTIISTLPLPEIIKIIPQVPLEIREAAESLINTSILTVFLGIDKEKITDKTWIYYDQPEISFFRLCFPNNLAQYTVPEGKSSIIAEIAYSKFKPLDKSEIISQVIQDLIKVGILTKDDNIIFKDFFDIKYGYVIFDRNRTPAVKKIKEYLKQNNIISIGRFGSWDYLWMHNVIKEAKDLVFTL
ncbi:FAD-dependent oxidoreductase [Candidatus Woesearchaeota archaeon]|nr:FAD-dependent oxidoreductase [Candidatus Woesearchaeota archaeon]